MSPARTLQHEHVAETPWPTIRGGGDGPPSPKSVDAFVETSTKLSVTVSLGLRAITPGASSCVRRGTRNSTRVRSSTAAASGFVARVRIGGASNTLTSVIETVAFERLKVNIAVSVVFRKMARPLRTTNIAEPPESVKTLFSTRLSTVSGSLGGVEPLGCIANTPPRTTVSSTTTRTSTTRSVSKLNACSF